MCVCVYACLWLMCVCLLMGVLCVCVCVCMLMAYVHRLSLCLCVLQTLYISSTLDKFKWQSRMNSHSHLHSAAIQQQLQPHVGPYATLRSDPTDAKGENQQKHKGVNPLGPRPAAALLLRNPTRREVTVSNDPGIQL